MKAVITCYASEEGVGCEYALLDLTEEVARWLVEKREAFKVFSENTKAIEARWWFRHIQYFDPRGQYGAETRPSDEEVERVSAILEGLNEFAEVPDDFDLPESMIARTTCEEVVVSRGEIQFACVPKHCATVVTTVPIELSWLEVGNE